MLRFPGKDIVLVQHICNEKARTFFEKGNKLTFYR